MLISRSLVVLSLGLPLPLPLCGVSGRADEPIPIAGGACVVRMIRRDGSLEGVVTSGSGSSCSGAASTASGGSPSTMAPRSPRDSSRWVRARPAAG